MGNPLTDTGRLDAIVEEALSDGRFTPDERRTVMARLLPADSNGALLRYGVMLALSVTIAAVGLMANSAAVVIGAMLVAPLMTPIITFATACALGLPQRMARAGFVVAISVIGSIILSYVLGAVLPDYELANEIVSRTSPDVRDFIVAVAAGAAGAYAVAREDLSTSLPGVAVAVALVPPLATVGILLERSEWNLAWGAALLFLTNLVAIVVVSMLVLFVTGVVPTIRLVARHPVVAGVVGVVVVIFVGISIPLTAASARGVRETQTRNEVQAAITEWIGDLDLVVEQFTVDGTTVQVDLVGPEQPPREFVLANDLEPVLGEDARVLVRWAQQSTGFAIAGQTEADALTAAERIEPLMVDWLATEFGEDYELLDLAVTGERVVVEVASPAAPEPDDALVAQLDASVDTTISDVTVQWVQVLGVGGSTDPNVIAAELVAAWIGPRTSVSLVGATASAGQVTVDLAAADDPKGLTRLVQALETRLEGRAVTVRVARLEAPPLTGTVDDIAPGAFG